MSAIEYMLLTPPSSFSALLRYRPTDLTPLKVKTEMRQAQESKTENDLINTFIRVRHNFRPVMRHFFTEKQQDPMAWFAMRLCYSRSMAVGCMAGYVLGLGDRHGSNILIDRGTGELIHIDLGIAFEQVSFVLFTYGID